MSRYLMESTDCDFGHGADTRVSQILCLGYEVSAHSFINHDEGQSSVKDCRAC